MNYYEYILLAAIVSNSAAYSMDNQMLKYCALSTVLRTDMDIVKPTTDAVKKIIQWTIPLTMVYFAACVIDPKPYKVK